MSELYAVFCVVVLAMIVTSVPLAVATHVEAERRRAIEAETLHRVELAEQRKAIEHAL